MLEHMGAVLLSVRQRKGVSQRALAKSLGVSAAHISLLETGKRTPSLDYLVTFSAAADIPVYLLVYASERHDAPAIPALDKMLRRLLNV